MEAPAGHPGLCPLGFTGTRESSHAGSQEASASAITQMQQLYFLFTHLTILYRACNVY